MVEFVRRGGWIPLLLGLVALGLLGGWLYYANQSRDLARNGIRTEAMITDKTENTSHRRNGTTRHSYLFDLRFDAAGTTIEARRSVAEDFWRRESIGNRIPLTYLPARPEVFEVEPGQIRRNATAAGWLALAVAGFAGFLGRIERRAHRRRRALRDRGIRTSGQVVYAVAAKGKRRMDVTFVDAKGIAHRVTATPAAIQQVGPPPAIGTQVPLIYDPEEPASAVPLDQYRP